jgi:hypothetical protein
MLRRIPGFLGF